MAAPAVVQVAGMDAIRRDMASLEADVSGPLYAALKAAGREAAEPIAALTRSRLPRNERSSGRLHGNIRVSGTRTGAAVRMGQKSIPWAGWVEFGGSRPDGSEREFVKGGRYLFPSAQTLATTAAASYSRSLTALFDRSAIWTNTGGDPGSVRD